MRGPRLGGLCLLFLWLWAGVAVLAVAVLAFAVCSALRAASLPLPTLAWLCCATQSDHTIVKNVSMSVSPLIANTLEVTSGVMNSLSASSMLA